MIDRAKQGPRNTAQEFCLPAGDGAHPEGEPEAFYQVSSAKPVDKSRDARYHASSMHVCEGIGFAASLRTRTFMFVNLSSQTAFCEVIGIRP